MAGHDADPTAKAAPTRAVPVRNSRRLKAPGCTPVARATLRVKSNGLFMMVFFLSRCVHLFDVSLNVLGGVVVDHQ
jgi:hypothetical protein